MQRQQFRCAAGIDTLDVRCFGGVTVSNLITGAVRTYVQNDNKNAGEQTDPTNGGSLDDLMDQDVTTPGFICISVCSAEIAFAAWSETSISSDRDKYPCYMTRLSATVRTPRWRTRQAMHPHPPATVWASSTISRVPRANGTSRTPVATSTSSYSLAGASSVFKAQ
jgi:hypothetical protein